MHHDAETRIRERSLPMRKRRTFNFVPYSIVAIVISVIVAMAALLGTAGRLVEKGVVKSKYDAILPEPVATAQRVFALEQPVSVKFRHVIFRVGTWEICRFTYEEGEPDDARESAHE